MDTCSRLEEPGGVGWKDVNVGRLRTSTSGKAVDLVASSGRSIGSVAKELGLRDSVLRRWVEQCGTTREPLAASRRPHDAGAAAIGGPRGGDRPFAAGK